MTSALTLIDWQAIKFVPGNFTDTAAVWLLIVVIVAVVAIFALAMQAALFLDAPHRLGCRAGWFANVPESTAAMPPSQVNLDGSGTPT
jgi:hypothetical protein